MGASYRDYSFRWHGQKAHHLVTLDVVSSYHMLDAIYGAYFAIFSSVLVNPDIVQGD